MADDREQRNFEIVKLRIAFLQHITTLSGAAILIILTLVQRAATRETAVMLALTAVMFVFAALIAVFSLTWILTFPSPELANNRVKESKGRFATAFASANFAAGIVVAAVSTTGVPPRTLVLVVYAAGIALLVPATVLIVWARLWARRTRRSSR